MDTDSSNENFSYAFHDIIGEASYSGLINDLGSASELSGLNTSDDTVYYNQLGELYRSSTDEAKINLINKVSQHIKSIGGLKQEYKVNMQLCHWFRTDINLGIAIAKGLDLDLSETMKQMKF